MRIIFSLWFLAFALLLAQEKSPQVVPVDQEPMHKLVFENEYVRVFSVEVPPGGETKYHRHERDYVSVILGEAKVESVRLGEASQAFTFKDGEARLTRGGFAHKAVNKGDKPFRNVTVELKKGTGELMSDSAPKEIVAGSGNKSILSGRGVSCWRIISGRVGRSVLEAELRADGEPMYLLIAAGETIIGMDTRTGSKRLRAGEIKWVKPSENVIVSAHPPGGALLCRFEAGTDKITGRPQR